MNEYEELENNLKFICENLEKEDVSIDSTMDSCINTCKNLLIKDGSICIPGVLKLYKNIPETQLLYKQTGLNKVAIGLGYKNKIAVEFYEMNKEDI